MRLFVAINLADEEKDRLHRALESLRQDRFPLRWVGHESVHLTLQFLGEVEDQRLAGIASAVRAAAAGHSPFALDIGGIGAFPNLRRPRVLWLGVRPALELTTLQAAVSNALELLGFAPETRPYSPHVTLARARSRAEPAQFTGLEAAAQRVDYTALVPVHSVELMHSHTGHDGARYQILRSVALEGSLATDPNGNRRAD